LKPGGPGSVRIDRIPVPLLPVDYVVRGPISTRDVLSDKEVMSSVNLAGPCGSKRALEEAYFAEFHANFPGPSRWQSDLASDWARDAIEAVEAAGGMASMIMLGDAVLPLAVPRP